MIPLPFKQLKPSQLIIVFISLIALVVFLALGVTLLAIGKRYQTRVDVGPGQISSVDLTQKTFYTKKIIMVKNGQAYEFFANGLGYQYEGAAGSAIKSRKIFSNQRIYDLFNSMSEADFASLIEHYFSVGGSFSLIIETTHGNKTIIFDDQGQQPPPDIIDDIVDDLDDLADDLNNPTPPPTAPPHPLPTAPPPTTPTPSGTPTPRPSSSATPTPTFAPAEPFRCDMLNGQINDVTVSNTVCEKPE